MKLKVAFLPEQAEAVPDLPADLHRASLHGRRTALGRGSLSGQRPWRTGKQRAHDDQTKRKAAHGAPLTLQLGQK
jgi:hypothetical protein